MKSEPRRYVQGARAAAVEQRRIDAVAAAMELFMSRTYDQVTLQSVADGAGVSLKTVVRMFGTKEGLIEACMTEGPRLEESKRVVPPGDLDAVVDVLTARYEALRDRAPHMIELSVRLPQVRRWLDASRQSHRAWLATVFAPHLPARGKERDVRLLQLFGATELYTWWSWREPLAASRDDARRALQGTLRALVASWRSNEGGTT